MASLSNEFPTEAALREKLDAVWDESFQQYFFDLSPRQEEVQRLTRRSLVSFFILLVVGGSLYLSSASLGGTVLTLLVVFVAGPLVIYFGLSLYELLRAKFELALTVNRFLYPRLLSVFSLEAEHHSGMDDTKRLGTALSRRSQSPDTDHNEVIEDLKRSELLTEQVEHDIVDDIIKTRFAGRPLTISEVRSTRRVEGSGKLKRTVTVFAGVFVSYELPTVLTGVTFLSTEGDETGYGHRDFWSHVLGNSTVEETELEWNDFERDLHVATSDGTEARYILTPDLMEDLYRWWSEHKRNIRLVFRGDRLYMLFPDNKVSIAGLTTSFREEKLKAYAMSVLSPLRHALLLLEDVNGRFSV